MDPSSASCCAFADEQSVGPRKRILLVLDGAGWHGAEQVEPPENLTLVWLPPYSPELQPAERLWPLVDEPLANRAFDSLPELDWVLEDHKIIRTWYNGAGSWFVLLVMY